MSQAFQPGYDRGREVGESCRVDAYTSAPGALMCRRAETKSAGSFNSAQHSQGLLGETQAVTVSQLQADPALYEKLKTQWEISPPTQVVGRDQGTRGTIDDAPDDAVTANLDPVNPANGDFYLYRDDLALPGRGVTFALRRAYHSRLELDGILGFGWDHSYNQRIVPSQAEGCDGEVVVALGLGRRMTFAKAIESATEITYKPERPVRYELRASKTNGAITGWRITLPDGHLWRFDSRGLLAAAIDSTGLGLTFTWEAAPSPLDWRLQRVTDAAQRRYSFSYPTGRLGSVTATGPGGEPLGATVVYSYDANGDLRSAQDAFGRTESYEYHAPVLVAVVTNPETGLPIDPFPWIPEQQLHEACEDYCAPAAETCRSSGICDQIAAQMAVACDESIWSCASGCLDECRARIVDESGDLHALAVSECLSASDGGSGCSDVCLGACNSSQVGFAAQCNYFAQLQEPSCPAECLEIGNDYDGRKCGPCATHADCDGGGICEAGRCVKPCTDSDECGADACGLGNRCECECGENGRCNTAPDWCMNEAKQACETAWTVFNGQGVCFSEEACKDHCAIQLAGTCRGQCRLGCVEGLEEGCVDALQASCPAACEADCTDKCLDQTAAACANQCVEDPDLGCDPPNWYAEQCAGIDWLAECHNSCVPECVRRGRGGGGTQPKYGYPTDLGHNLLRIRDGEGVLYLENFYGTDPSKPDFDSVQRAS